MWVDYYFFFMTWIACASFVISYDRSGSPTLLVSGILVLLPLVVVAYLTIQKKHVFVCGGTGHCFRVC